MKRRELLGPVANCWEALELLGSVGLRRHLETRPDDSTGQFVLIFFYTTQSGDVTSKSVMKHRELLGPIVNCWEASELLGSVGLKRHLETRPDDSTGQFVLIFFTRPRAEMSRQKVSLSVVNCWDPLRTVGKRRNCWEASG